jgi:hypothetical protein
MTEPENACAVERREVKWDGLSEANSENWLLTVFPLCHIGRFGSGVNRASSSTTGLA